MADEPEHSKFIRDDEFAAYYANNVFYESTAWDLKLIFGEWDQARGTVVQHTGITLTWPQVRLLIYFLQANLAYHEGRNGASHFPPEMLPPKPELAGDDSSKPWAESTLKRLKELHEQFLKSAK